MLVKARFVMDRDYLTLDPSDSVLVARWRMQTSPHRTAYIVGKTGTFLGIVRYADLSTDPGHRAVVEKMLPAASVCAVAPEDDVSCGRTLFAAHPEWRSVPVVSDDSTLLGVLTRDLPETSTALSDQYGRAVARGILDPQLLNVLTCGLLIVDGHCMVRELNSTGGAILGVDPADVINRPFEEVAVYIFAHMEDYLRQGLVPTVMTSDAMNGEQEVVIQNGRHVHFSLGVIREKSKVVAIIMTFNDVTKLRAAEIRAQEEARETEMAFGLALPNSKVEAKLKASPEYQDIYDPQTRTARVTAVIPDGTYRHVINGLRLMAELKQIGVFQLVGVDKDTLVQAFIYHDLGKDQPLLHVGQTFVPQDTFEPGCLHAARSAEWAVKEYGVSEEVAWLTRYHHTAAVDLPSTFPMALMPMWRLFKLVDGLSAGITRRLARVAPITLTGTVLTIREINPDARYDRSYQLPIYSGEESDRH